MRQAMEIAFDREFLPSLGRLDPGDSQRVLKSVTRYQQEPEAPGLNLKQLKGRHGRRRLWSIRASQELRVLLVREGATSVLLRAGHRKAIYALAECVAFAAPVSGRLGLIPLRPDALDLDGSVITLDPAATAPAADSEPSRNRVRNALQGLRAAGLRCQSLNQFDGVPNDAVKVDTSHRAKGLEFKAVFLLGAAAFPPAAERAPDRRRVRRTACDADQPVVRGHDAGAGSALRALQGST